MAEGNTGIFVILEIVQVARDQFAIFDRLVRMLCGCKRSIARAADRTSHGVIMRGLVWHSSLHPRAVAAKAHRQSFRSPLGSFHRQSAATAVIHWIAFITIESTAAAVDWWCRISATQSGTGGEAR